MLPLLLLASASAASPGDCIEVRGNRITLADLAARVSEFGALPGSEVVGLAPHPGVHRTFRSEEIQAIGRKHGLELATPPGVCVQRAIRWLRRDEILKAMRAALPFEPSTLLVHEWSRFPIPDGEVTFSIDGMQPLGKGIEVLWTGYVRYSANQRLRVWARASVGVKSTRVIAVTALRAGASINPADVREELAEVLPGNNAGTRTSGVVGRVARRALPAGSVVRAEHLDTPAAVRQGDAVLLRSRVGAALVSIEAIAQADAKIGQPVLLLNAATGRKIRATVRAPGVASVVPVKTKSNQEVSIE